MSSVPFHNLLLNESLAGSDLTQISQSASLNNNNNNRDIVLLKPDKGSGVVLLNKSDYIREVNDILKDNSKFQLNRFNTVEKAEKKINNKLKHLLNSSIIDMKTYIELRAKGSKMPHMYGLPKLHKENMPLRPIVSMVNSPYHKLARWLVEIIKPIEHTLSKHEEYI